MAASEALLRALAARQLGLAQYDVDQSQIAYLMRILGSRLAPSVVENEDHVADRAQKRLLREDATNTTSLQFNKLHYRLKTKASPHTRWSVLTFMLLVSEQGTQPAVPLLVSEVFSEGGLRRIPVAPPVVRQRHEVPSSTSASVLPGYTRYLQHVQDGRKLVPEDALIRDLLFVFQGIDGRYIRWDATADEFVLDSRADVSASTRLLVSNMCVIGWHHRRITELLAKLQKDPSFGSVGQCFHSAMTELLAEHQRLVVVLESQIAGVEASGDGIRALTLKRLQVWMVEPFERLKVLAMMAECCQGKGGALISSIYKYARHGDPGISSVVERLLEKICAPFFDMLVKWIEEGTLDDPQGEFMVSKSASASAVVEADPWARKYSCRTAMVPAFFSTELTNKILLIGKSINFIRYVCKDEGWALPVAIKREELVYSNMNGLEATVDAACSSCSKRLLELLFGKHKLMDHMSALRKYLLLEQGDFVQVLMDQLAEDLDRPASSLSLHHVISKFETAVQSSNAQHESPDVLPRLMPRLLKPSPNDLGWRVFSLDYHVDPPLSSVVTDHHIKQYRQIFTRLWGMKRTQNALETAWREQLGFGGGSHVVVEMRKELHHCHILREHMFHFMAQMQYYVMFEVLECSWDDLNRDLKRDGNLDDVIASHGRYLHGIAAKLLLDESSQAASVLLLRLYDIISGFRAAQGTLYRILETELNRRSELVQHAGVKTKAGKWGLTTKDRAESLPPAILQGPVRDARRQLGQVSGAYDTTLKQLLVELGRQSDESLRSLRTRLDYNDYYESHKDG